MAEPPSVLCAVCLDHTSDGRKVDLGLKCWRWGRADDNELTFWVLRRFVHALFRWEQKHVLPSRVIKRSRTEWANLFRSRVWFWDDVFTESSQRCRAIEGAVQIQVFAVQTKAALAILVQWVVLRHRKRARTTARAMLCGFLKCCCTVESIASLSFQPLVLAASTHCQAAPTYNVRCACLNDSLAKLGRLQQMEAHPNITAMLVTLFEDRTCLSVRSIFVNFVESLSLAMERDCASAMKKDPMVLPPLSSGKARLRLCEDMKRKYTHTLVMQRKLATGADLLRTNDGPQMARTLYAKWVRQRMRRYVGAMWLQAGSSACRTNTSCTQMSSSTVGGGLMSFTYRTTIARMRSLRRTSAGQA